MTTSSLSLPPRFAVRHTPSGRHRRLYTIQRGMTPRPTAFATPQARTLTREQEQILRTGPVAENIAPAAPLSSTKYAGPDPPQIDPSARPEGCTSSASRAGCSGGELPAGTDFCRACAGRAATQAGPGRRERRARFRIVVVRPPTWPTRGSSRRLVTTPGQRFPHACSKAV